MRSSSPNCFEQKSGQAVQLAPIRACVVFTRQVDVYSTEVQVLRCSRTARSFVDVGWPVPVADDERGIESLPQQIGEVESGHDTRPPKTGWRLRHDTDTTRG